jgi:hypothetical protein
MELLTLTAAAARVGVSQDTIERRIKEGILIPVRNGSRKLVRLDDLERIYPAIARPPIIPLEGARVICCANLKGGVGKSSIVANLSAVLAEDGPTLAKDPLAVRASKKMRNDELLLTSFAPTRLKMELDRVPLWDGNDKSHVAIADVVDYFAKYLYLPRLKVPGLLLTAVQDGLKLLTWNQDSFAYADSFDEAGKRYRGLVCGRLISLGTDIPDGLLVRSEVAIEQLNAEAPQSATNGSGLGTSASDVEMIPGTGLLAGEQPAKQKARPTRFHGSVPLDATRVGRDAGRIADEVVSHLAGIVGAKVKVTLEIEGDIPEGASEEIVRIVTQNSRDLKFDPGAGFED